MQKGFTLVEIIIVIAIMGISVGIGFTTYTRQIQVKTFDQDISTFVTMLDTARSRTIGRDISPHSNCSSNFSGYQVTIYRSLNLSVQEHDSYRVKVRCPPNYPGISERFYMKNTVIYNGGNNSYYNVDFFLPYGCISSNCSITRTISFKNKILNQCKNVNIDSLGRVSIADITCP